MLTNLLLLALLFSTLTPPPGADPEVPATTNSGPLPSSYGASLRGPALAAEPARLLNPGRSRISLRFEASNNILREFNGESTLVYKSETHSLILDYRRGLKTAKPIEIGISAELQERDTGFLNGFINSAEHLAARLPDREQ